MLRGIAGWRMKTALAVLLALGLLSCAGEAWAQLDEGAAQSRPLGFVGGLFGAGFGVNGEMDSGRKPYYETSLLFAVRGGLLLGEGHRHVLSFEVAPTTNRIDWRLRGTATFFASYGTLVPVRDHRDWSWLWRVGLGVGGGYDYRFLLAAQLDVLTFTYKMSNKLWVDFGVPTIRFYIETASQAHYGVQFVFPLGITFAI